MKRPFASARPVGPLTNRGVGFRDNDSQFRWAVNDEVAHHIYQKTRESNYVNFGHWTVLLQAFMNHFPDRSRSDNINNWYQTRTRDGDYDNHEQWVKIPRKLDLEDPMREGREVTTDILFDETTTPNPEGTKVTSQQYTAHGAMFTYEFDQDWGEEGHGFVRVPVPRELSDEAKQIANGTKFEYFEFQHREYTSEFSDRQLDRATYYHPHFRSESLTSAMDIKIFIDKAFDIMEKGVKLERRTK